jgi:hypothetical protein
LEVVACVVEWLTALLEAPLEVADDVDVFLTACDDCSFPAARWLEVPAELLAIDSPA